MLLAHRCTGTCIHMHLRICVRAPVYTRTHTHPNTKHTYTQVPKVKEKGIRREFTSSKCLVSLQRTEFGSQLWLTTTRSRDSDTFFWPLRVLYTYTHINEKEISKRRQKGQEQRRGRKAVPSSLSTFCVSCTLFTHGSLVHHCLVSRPEFRRRK